jgi:broad specificity phosphatase PhoE
MNINWIFVRHGFGCHNALSSLVESNMISQDDGLKLSKELIDPELTPIGVEASLNNGCVVSALIKKMASVVDDVDAQVHSVDIVGCSPLIRSMETAFYMTRNWKTPPKTIYVFPHLREIDESSSNKFSWRSYQKMENTPSYAMKSITEQKRFLQENGILQYFDFSFVEIFHLERKSPGDIPNFMRWFIKNVGLKSGKQKLNTFIVTHAGVLKDFSGTGYHNNSGLFINSKIDGQNIINKTGSLHKLLPESFFKDYYNPEYLSPEYYCPTSRCASLCSAVKSNKLKKPSTLSNACSKKSL